MLHPYPQDIFQGLEAIRRTTAIVRGGNIAANKVELGACVYTALGVAMKTGIGDFVEPAFGAVNDEANSDKAEQETELAAAVVELANEVDSYTGQATYGAAADASGKVNWRELFKTLLPILLQLL
jgi:hypothetical protein